MVVERRTEAVQEGDAAEPRRGADGGVGVRWHACRSAQQPLDLVKKNLREGGDGLGPVGKHAAQSLRHGDHPLPHGHRRDDVVGEVGGGCRTGRRRGPCRRRRRRAPGRSRCTEHGRIRSRGCRTRDSRGVPPRRSPAQAAPPGHATRASSRDAPTRSCGAVSSRGDDARGGGQAGPDRRAAEDATDRSNRCQRPEGLDQRPDAGFEAALRRGVRGGEGGGFASVLEVWPTAHD